MQLDLVGVVGELVGFAALFVASFVVMLAAGMFFTL